MNCILLLLVATIHLNCNLAGPSGSLTIGKQLCELEEAPLLVDTPTPRFGWQLHSTENGVSQTAYELEIFDSGGNIVWKSGKVISDQSQHIPYSGERPLEAGEQYGWRVRVWDNKGNGSPWSKMSQFRMAPDLNKLNAQWIGAIKRKDSNLPEGRDYHSVSDSSEKGERWRATNPLSKRSIYLRRTFKVQKRVKSAIVYISGLGHYELSLNGKKIGNDQFNPLWSDYDKTVYYNGYDLTAELTRGENAVGGCR
jgi:alpha-L-rhamnosidase